MTDLPPPRPGPVAAPDAGVLDNVVWHALHGRQAPLAEVVGTARRFPVDVSPFAGVEALDERGWADLAQLAGPGRQVLLARSDIGTPPTGWLERWRRPGYQMVLEPGSGDEVVAAVADVGLRALGGPEAAAMAELVALAQPGPWEARTWELGGYVGLEEAGRLVVMAGQRMDAGGFTEISAVATHPDARRRGLAAAATAAVARGILARGDRPILHVAEGNDNARRVYEVLGFRTRSMIEFVILSTPR